MQNSETLLQVDQNGTVGPKASSPSFLAGVLALAGGAVVAQGIGFAVPSNQVLEFIDNVRAGRGLRK